MEDKENENTPLKRTYPKRVRKKVKYEEFEMSLEVKPKSKRAKSEASSDEEDQSQSDEEGSNYVDDDDGNEMSEYEKQRLKNLEENRKIMMELGLIDPEKEIKLKAEVITGVGFRGVGRPLKKKTGAGRPLKGTSRPSHLKPKTPRTPVEPTKRSLRLQKKTPEGNNIPMDLFLETPSESPVKEEITRLVEEVLPMNEDGETTDFLDSLKASLSQSSATSTQSSTTSSINDTESLIKNMRKLTLSTLEKVTSARIQSMCVHPMENELLVLCGSVHGELGMWNATDGKLSCYSPHLRAVNCITVGPADHNKVFTTSHDGTVRRADLTKQVFDLVYQTDEKMNMCHITWHSHFDEDTLLVAHGTGDLGVVDLRAKRAQRWFHCHPRSIRTVQVHPTQSHYFLTSSGTGECKIWDIRGTKKHEDEPIGEFTSPKNGRGRTSAFFSPDGTKVVTTCNDDFLRIYDTSDVTNPREVHRVVHDNHTGRWLSVFKAIWHPCSSDLFFVGSMLNPRRIQMFNGSAQLVKELKHEDMTTVNAVVALHPTLPVLLGGNSSGRAHIFINQEAVSHLVKADNRED